MQDIVSFIEAGDLEHSGFFVELNQKIQHLIQNDMNALIQFLYRMDIAEKDAKKAFLEFEDTEIAKQITVLVIEKQKKKIEYRNKYKNV